MTSMIDPSKPGSPVAYTADQRANWAAAKSEIEALQSQTNGAPFLPLDGGTLTGSLFINPAAATPDLISLYSWENHARVRMYVLGTAGAPTTGIMYDWTIGLASDGYFQIANDILGQAALVVDPQCNVTLPGTLTLQNVPTADPHIVGKLWADPAAAHVLKVSQG